MRASCGERYIFALSIYRRMGNLKNPVMRRKLSQRDGHQF
jgi:hypothetical protein